MCSTHLMLSICRYSVYFYVHHIFFLRLPLNKAKPLLHVKLSFAPSPPGKCAYRDHLLIDWVSILALSWANLFQQGFMLIADVVFGAGTCGSGSVIFQRHLRVFTEALQDIRGSIAS